MKSIPFSNAAFVELRSRVRFVDRYTEKIQRLLNKLSQKQRRLLYIGLAVASLLLLDFAYNMICFETTDDSFVKGHMHVISARIPGTVQSVMVDDNKMVKVGDPLVQLDQRDYEVQIKVAQANYSKAHKDVGRFDKYLNELGPADKPVFDQYQANALVSEAELTRAQLQYEYTSIKAPSDGKIGKRNVEVGDQVQVGQALMALVEPNPWVEANFKEHQVSHIRVGQKVTISVDSIPDKTFIGHVDSVAPGSGSLFSLLPPDNATGNFTKIVQRIPVKIVFDADSVKGYEDRLVPGMSTEVSVKVR
jgi:membrane fusion protein, multidrug efflux system